MIDTSKLTQQDIGRWVEYWPNKEKGRIKSWKGSLIFVVYHCGRNWDRFQDYSAGATHHKSLNFVDEVGK